MSEDQKRICLGKITGVHGIKGLVKLHIYAEDPALLDRPLYTSKTGPATLEIESRQPHKKGWLAAIKGCTDRDAAESLAGTKLFIPRDDLPKPNEDEFYYEDLTGLEVHDEMGTAVGTVRAVQNFGAGDLLEIKPVKGGPTFFLPFTQETIGEISDKHIVVYLPEGLF